MERIVPRLLRNMVALVLVGSLAGVAPVALAQEAVDAVSLSGRIFQADGSTPYSQVTVRVMDQAAGTEVATTTTNAAGEYWFENLEPGTYTVEVEVPDGIYQLDRAIEIGAAEKATISFTVKPGAVGAGGSGAAASQGMGKKKKGALIAIISAGAVLAAVLLLDDDDDEGSPFVP